MQRQSIVYLLSLLFIATNLHAQTPRRQPIPIGMFNAYLPEDGNLALSTPDLREVWQGMPTNWPDGEFPFEACNLVQHYWPTPIPPNNTGEDPYIAWSKHFLTEVYEQTNVDGEVRLRAIVGELFQHYDRLGAQWLTRFIQSLCTWEENGPQDGVIAGWYLAEEPMGGSKNYDVGKYEQMVAVIDEAERSGGFRRHDRYLDTGVDGKYITPNSFARFTRPADVIMISASPYIWLTGRTQPVYSPQWVAFPYCLNFVRQIVWPDREAHGLPKPKIHMVLQGAELRNHRPTDNRSYGQPTNWEMRQQIRKILTPDTQYTGSLIEPADGFWIFWWTGLTFDNDNRVDDWVHGRRLAEALEVEVAELTGYSHEVRSPYTPRFTRFLFPTETAFNPNESNIPYELARSGEVVVEVRRPNGILVERFNMGVQSAGRLERFGGPDWKPGGSNPDGRYSFVLFLDKERMDSVTVDVQTRPALSSPSHKTGYWNQQNEVELVWQAPSAVEGIAGYAFSWDESSSGVPPRTIQLDPDVTALVSDPLPDGNSHYFHIRHVDALGQWSDTATLGPFWIDSHPPAFAGDVSASHPTDVWQTVNSVQLMWTAASDPHSGLHGYSLVWDQSPTTEPKVMLNVGSGITELTSPPLTDGEWFAHLRAVDHAGNWGSTLHAGPFRIDTVPPEPPLNVHSLNHTSTQWSAQTTIEVEWGAASDATSGTAAYRFWWDDNPQSMPSENSQMTNDTRIVADVLVEGEHWFHLQAEDRAGLASEARHFGPFFIDLTPPKPAAFVLRDTNGDPYVEGWTRDNAFSLEWEPGEDAASGVDATRLSLARSDSSTEIISSPVHTEEYLLETSPLALQLLDGFWQISLVTRDLAGNTATASQTVQVDTQISVPLILSSTHPDPDTWYASNQVQMQWELPVDLSGIELVRWSVDIEPDATLPAEPTPLETQADFSVATGIHVFYLLVMDRAGNRVMEHRRIQVDDIPPSAPAIQSTTHTTDAWSANPNLTAQWVMPLPASGVAGYSTILDGRPDTEPPPVLNTQSPVLERSLPDGIWYLHVRAQGGSGLWSTPSHYVVRVDTTPPLLRLRSLTHDSQSWSPNRDVQFVWSADESGSGIRSFLWAWDQSVDTLPTQVADATVAEMSLSASEDGVYYFHLQAEDQAGNRSIVSHFRVQMDASAPGVPVLRSLTHPHGEWTNRVHPLFQWSQPASVSGINGYSVALTTNANTVPDEAVDTAVQQFDIPSVMDGIHYFHVRAQSVTGLWGEADHYEIRIDTQAPEVRITWPESDHWYAESIREYRGLAQDELSGIDWGTLEYQYNDLSWHAFQKDVLQGNTVTAEDVWVDGNEIPDTEDTAGTSFQVRVADRAGNVGVSSPVQIKVDTQRPVVHLSSPTHPRSGMLSNKNRPSFSWEAESNHARIMRYFWGVDQQPEGRPTQILSVDTNQLTLEPVPDGESYFHLAAQNEAGQTSEPVHWALNVDTVPPVAILTWRGPNRESLGPSADLPYRMGAGHMYIHITVSEPIRETPPPFSYRVEGYTAIPLSLEPDGSEGWQAVLHISPQTTPDGPVSFDWSAMDRAGNMADPVIANVFVIDTLLIADATGPQRVWGEDEVRLDVPPEALTQQVRLTMFSVGPPLATPPGRILTGYQIKAFSETARPLVYLDFHSPCILTAPIRGTPRRLYLFDGVQFQPVSSWSDDGFLRAEIQQTGDYFIIASADRANRAIEGGWAAPNPFTPNGSGDASDRTVFHVVKRDPSIIFRVEIFDIRGRRVRALPTDEPIWDGRDDSGDLLQGGVYLYQIEAEDERISGSVVLVR